MRVRSPEVLISQGPRVRNGRAREFGGSTLSDGPRPEFVAPDQMLDGSDRPQDVAGQAHFVPEATAEPETHGGRRRWLWSGAAAAAVLLAGAAAWAGSGSGEEHPAVARFTSMPDLCSTVSRGTLGQYAPNAADPIADPVQDSGSQRYGTCGWAEPTEGKGRSLTSRQVRVAIRLHLDGSRLAESDYDAAFGGAVGMAGTAKSPLGSLHAEAPNQVSGIGERAFSHHRTLAGSLGKSGTVATTVLLRNAVIAVEYRGSTFPLASDGTAKLGESTPLDEAAARSGAEAIARDVTRALASCTSCLTR